MRYFRRPDQSPSPLSPIYQRVTAYPGLLISAVLLSSYAATLLPGIGYGDTAEFQRVAPTLGLAHIPGYPLYTLLGWGWSQLPLGGSPAWQMNLLSALLGSCAIGSLFWICRLLQHPRSIAAAVALSFGFSATFWAEATHAEVYALALVFQMLVIGSLLLWRRQQIPLWTCALLLGLGVTHHRIIGLMIPGLIGFVLLERRLSWRDGWQVALAFMLPFSLYSYIPLHAQPWENPWQLLWDYFSAQSVNNWLDPGRLWAEGLSRPGQLLRSYMWPALTPPGLLLALVGSLRIWRRDRTLALLLIGSYGCCFSFCCAYYVPDIEVFLLPCHAIQALLAGEGWLTLLDRVPRHKSLVAWFSLGLPLLQIVINLPRIQQANTSEPEQTARSFLAQPLSYGAVVIAEPRLLEACRYLQAIEGLRPDLEFRFSADRPAIDLAWSRSRAVYVQQPITALGLQHSLEGTIWRVLPEPLTATVKTPLMAQWSQGLRLTSFFLEPGPYLPGSRVPITLTWIADQPVLAADIIFLHLEDASGRIWGQIDQPPASQPIQTWQPGEPQIEIYAIPLHATTPPGEYAVKIGWYSSTTLQRLPLLALAGAPVSSDYLQLGTINVVAP